ncbi:MAG: 3-dehydroquinate synthase [Lachnospiraceae bacterium]|nr:3-dehydroquinate synthase [Lachnospiraceae bacterium]
MLVLQDGRPCYEIEFTDGFSGLADVLSGLGFSKRRIAVISDSLVAPLYLSALTDTLKGLPCTLVSHVIPAGEEHKTLDTVRGIYRFLIGEHFDRHDLLLALGGGVTGDITGFAAATFLRGISFVQIPTTLLAQCDSSIGGKTGVDFEGYKNMVGAFKNPRLVWMNLTTLKTLDDRQFLAGFAEVIKHGFIMDRAYFDWLLAHREQILKRDVGTLIEMIEKSCDIKRQVVEEDPKEQGLRAVLNFGHTIGHAIEKYSGFTLLHGECVSLGMRAAAAFSVHAGKLSGSEEEELVSALTSFGLPVRFAHTDQDTDALLSLIRSDKKADGDQVKFVLLSGIGKAGFTHIPVEDLRVGVDAL